MSGNASDGWTCYTCGDVLREDLPFVGNTHFNKGWKWFSFYDMSGKEWPDMCPKCYRTQNKIVKDLVLAANGVYPD